MKNDNINPGTLQKRPGSLLKMFLRFPVFLHHLGLGGWERLIGLQWMFITTIGRKTGKPRHAMVDVIDYYKETGIYYIEAAYGKRADWYRNIQADPVFHAQVGRRKFEARATPLSPEETEKAIVAFVRRRPVYARSVMAMVGLKFKDEDELRSMARQWILLAVQPSEKKE